jgi:ABC-type transporter Mla subunit MlaD
MAEKTYDFERLERVITTGFGTLADLQGETNARLGQTNDRLDQANERLDQHDALLVSLVDVQREQGRQLGTLIDMQGNLVDMQGRTQQQLTRIADGMDSLNGRIEAQLELAPMA